jgi:hypothetical protein
LWPQFNHYQPKITFGEGISRVRDEALAPKVELINFENWRFFDLENL